MRVRVKESVKECGVIECVCWCEYEKECERVSVGVSEYESVNVSECGCERV